VIVFDRVLLNRRIALRSVGGAWKVGLTSFVHAVVRSPMRPISSRPNSVSNVILLAA
jgi:hypothetical protein